jgi:amino acid adenylation domain-containing protein/thioester reductase-like protein
MLVNHENLIELFDSIVSKYPNRPAIKDCKSVFTYLELYQLAAGVAGILQQHDVISGERIACISKKDTESIICFWGILLSGAIPVMLDHDDGGCANEAKLKTVSPRILIMDKSDQVTSPVFSSGMIFDFDELIRSNETPPNNFFVDQSVVPEICYILLTSGTSGIPKAVQISHQNVLHYTYAIYHRIGKPQQVIAAHVTTFSADLGLTNLLVALVSGGMLRIFNKEESTDPAVFNGILKKEQVSLLKMTPSHLLSILSGKNEAYEVPVENLILGGEKLSWNIVERLFSLNTCKHLYNHYGPTETTVGVMVYKVEKESVYLHQTASVPIGTPLGNMEIFLENEVDAIGELFIAGPGVSKGYLENDQENEKRFVDKKINGSLQRCFRTGDLCRKLDSGELEFLYRTDRQVKVRGYRIELGEIEVVLISHPEIENVVLALSDNAEHAAIEAFIKIVHGGKLRQDTLREWLNTRLPGYKVPSVIYFYEETPYNANGKIDLKALRKRFAKNGAQAITKIEKEVHHHWATDVEVVWASLLGLEQVSGSDNFFETGGDSLLAIQMIGRLQRYGYVVHISHLNKYPVFNEFIAFKPELLKEENFKPLSAENNHTYSQNSFLSQEKFNLDHYCQSILFETEDQIDIRQLSIALNYVIKNHSQITAPVFNMNAENKEISGDVKTDVGITILAQSESKAVQIQKKSVLLQRQICLSCAELFKAHLFIDQSGKDYLLLICHHLVIDVISWNIILDELLEYYNSLLSKSRPIVIPENAVNVFYNKLIESNFSQSEQSDTFGEVLYKLPEQSKDYARQEQPKVYHLVIPSEMAEVLKYMDDHKDASMLSSFLLSAFGSALLTAFGLPALSVDIEFHGRPQYQELPDLSRSVAWWATTLPVNLHINNCEPLDCLDLLKNKTDEASTVNLSNKERLDRFSNYPDVRFNYLGHFPAQFGNGQIRLKPSSFNSGPTRGQDAQQEYQLFFTSRFIGTVLSVDLQYQPGRFDKEAIDRIVSLFFNNLKKDLIKEGFNVGSSTLKTLLSNLPSVGQPLYHLNFYQQQTIVPIKQKNVFLTGATGFLGTHILAELLRDDQVAVYCLVRGNALESAENRLKDGYRYYFNTLPDRWQDRVKVIEGDLKFINFGIPVADFDMLTQEIDVVIHAAADINLLKDYAELIDINVNTTRQIITFVGTGKSKELHFVSTLAVSGYLRNTGIRDFAENDFNYGQGFISDYEKTKFEAEHLVREFFKSGGSGKIYRSGHIAADSVKGRFQKNAGQNRIFQIIKGMMLLKSIPEIYAESVSFSYVDVVAAAIVNFSLNKAGSDMQCLHLENTQQISFKNIAGMLNDMGNNIKFVDMDVFRIAIADFDGSIKDKEAVNLMATWIQRSIDFPRNINYVQADSLDAIARNGLYFPDTTYNWFVKLINEEINDGYFNLNKKTKQTAVLIP